MKCVKCGKEGEQCKCRSCGFDICSRKFSGIYKMNSKSINAINSLIKSSQVFKYDNESIEYGSTVRSGAAVSNKRATETPNKSGHNNSVPTTPQRRKKGRLLWPSLIIVMCAVIAFIVVKYMDRQSSSDNGLIVIPANAAMGDTVAFGYYEQDADLSNGKEPINWFIADMSNGKALLVSEKCLDCMPYSVANSDSWTGSDVREWLNNDFYSNSFSAEEQAFISESSIISGYPVLPSDYMHEENTSDKIFVLDFDEYREYVTGDAKLTAYARKEYLAAINDSDYNTYESAEEEYCSNETEYGENYSWCLLRNLGPIENTVQFVSWFDEAGIAAVGNGFCDASCYVAIRPAVWVNATTQGSTNSEENTESGSIQTISERTDVCAALGNNEYGQCNVKDWNNVVDIATPFRATVGLRADGTLLATGDNTFGQCNVEKWNDIIQIEAAGIALCALKSDGTVLTTNEDNTSYIVQEEISDWTHISSFAYSGGMIVGVMDNGTVVYCVSESNNDDYELRSWDNIKTVKIFSNNLVVGLKNDGTVVMSSHYNTFYDISGWTDIIDVDEVEMGTALIGLRSDGTVLKTETASMSGTERFNVSDWNDIVSISCGYDHVVGLRSDGTVVACRDSASSKEYLNGDKECAVEDWKDIVEIRAAAGITVGIKNDGFVVATDSGNFDGVDFSELSCISQVWLVDALQKPYVVAMKKD